MYPDWLSLTGEGYVASMYKKYGKSFLPWAAALSCLPGMKGEGCILRMTRMFLYLWDVSILAPCPSITYDSCQSKTESQDFYEVLDYYLNLIRQLHIRTYAYLGEMRASTNLLRTVKAVSWADI